MRQHRSCQHAQFVYLVSLSILVALAGTTLLVQAAPARQDTSAGKQIFIQKCAACHTIGGGRLVGPDLKDAVQNQDTTWLKKFVLAPDQVIASGDPIAVKLVEQYSVQMPNLGLSSQDVENVLAYISAQAGSANAQPEGASPTQFSQPSPEVVGAAVAQTVPSISVAPLQSFTPIQEVLMLNGDPQGGQDLFTGAEHLQNGGTPCISCHTIRGVGSLGGGSLGPDLTHVYSRYTRTGLASALVGLPFPTMQGIFAEKPLTASERADLLAFFAQADQEGAPKTGTNFQILVGSGAVGTGLLLAAMLFFYPRQRMSIGERLRRTGSIAHKPNR
jgi:mono/diheme cytochrome c family protein